jgi:hypothetical protein
VAVLVEGEPLGFESKDCAFALGESLGCGCHTYSLPGTRV